MYVSIYLSNFWLFSKSNTGDSFTFSFLLAPLWIRSNLKALAKFIDFWLLYIIYSVS